MYVVYQPKLYTTLTLSYIICLNQHSDGLYRISVLVEAGFRVKPIAMSQTLTKIVYSTYRSNTCRCIFSSGCAIAIFFVSLYTSGIALRLGNNLPVANFHRWAAMTSFSHAVPLEGVTFQLIWLPRVTRAHCVLAHNRLINMRETMGLPSWRPLA